MKQLHYSIQIFLQKLRQSRMYTLLILETYILYIYVQPVIKFSQDVKYPSTPWLLPFLFSNIYFIYARGSIHVFRHTFYATLLHVSNSAYREKKMGNRADCINYFSVIIFDVFSFICQYTVDHQTL